MDDLKICPLCGGEPHWFYDIGGVSIECIDCGFRMGVNYADDGNPTTDDDRKKLAEIWNSCDRTKTPKKEEKEEDDDYC